MTLSSTRHPSSRDVELMDGVEEELVHREVAVAVLTTSRQLLVCHLNLSIRQVAPCSMKQLSVKIKGVAGEVVAEVATITSMERVAMKVEASRQTVTAVVITISTSHGSSMKNSTGQVRKKGTRTSIVLNSNRGGVAGVSLISEVVETTIIVEANLVGTTSNSHTIKVEAIVGGLEGVESKMKQVVAAVATIAKEEVAPTLLNTIINDRVVMQANRTRSRRSRKAVETLLKNFTSFVSHTIRTQCSSYMPTRTTATQDSIRVPSTTS